MKILEIKKHDADIDGKKIINSLSIDVEKGEVIAIMGQTGSEKSTLSKKIVGDHLKNEKDKNK